MTLVSYPITLFATNEIAKQSGMHSARQIVTLSICLALLLLFKLYIAKGGTGASI
jgi:uncharacterized PurR-regulated membrane protein YhhQ (DUF165 family)